MAMLAKAIHVELSLQGSKFVIYSQKIKNSMWMSKKNG
jgi:hypothetical protein